jgi:hypothetical protein
MLAAAEGQSTLGAMEDGASFSSLNTYTAAVQSGSAGARQFQPQEQHCQNANTGRRASW